MVPKNQNNDELKESRRANRMKWHAEHADHAKQWIKQYYNENSEYYRQYRMNRYYGDRDAINRRAKELRQLKRFGELGLSSKRCVLVDFSSKEVDEIAPRIESEKPLRKVNAVPPLGITSQRSVSLTFD